MPRDMTPDDHRRADLVLLLLIEIDKITALRISRERLQEVMPFYLFFLALAGQKDLMFFRDVISDWYLGLEESIAYWYNMQFVRIEGFDKITLCMTPRAIFKFEEGLQIEAGAKLLVKKAAHLAASVYLQDILFDEAVKETYFFHNLNNSERTAAS